MDDDREDLPTQEAWQRAAEAGADVVYKAIRDKMNRRLERGDNPLNLFAMMIGGIAQLAQDMGELTCDNQKQQAEDQLIAHVRGAFRGAGQAVYEGGKPWCPMH